MRKSAKRQARRICKAELVTAAISIDQAFAELQRRGVPATPATIRQMLRRAASAQEIYRRRAL